MIQKTFLFRTKGKRLKGISKIIFLTIVNFRRKLILLLSERIDYFNKK